MTNKIRLVITLLFFILDNNAHGESYPKGSLVFVIDKTISMQNVIDSVKSKSTAIFETVSHSEETPVENFILVTFGDDVSEATITTDPEKFKNAVSSIELEGGGECPEKSMSGIKKALEACLAGSYLYVFTDASADDYDKVTEVAKIAQEKDSQVVFILTNETLCEGVSNSTVNGVYLELAYMTSGQVFTMLDVQIKKIIKYVEDSIKSRKVILYTLRKNKPGHHTLQFKTDTRTKDTTIALTGSYTHLTVFGPDGYEVYGKMLVTTNGIKVLKLIESDLGVYNVSYYSSNSSYIVVSAWSDIHFRHGFSKNISLSFNDTVLKPFPGVKNYITVKLYAANVKLSSVLLLNSSYGTMVEIPLRTLDENKNLYVTDPFISPNFTMRVAINGTDEIEDTAFTRFGIMLLESDGMVTDNLVIESNSEVKQRPITFLEVPKSITVDFNEKAVLNCKVDAFPVAEITWHYKEPYNKYFPIWAVQISTDGTTLTIEHMQPSTRGIYVCQAINKNEKKWLRATLSISAVIPEINKTSTHVNVGEGGNVTLRCSIVEGKPEPSIRWYRQTSMFPIVKFREMEQAINQTDVILTNLNRYDTGIYKCRAQNIMGVDVHAINVSVEFQPEIEDDIKSIVVKNGDEIKNITCNVQGIPTPNVVWTKDGKPIDSDIHVYRYHSWKLDKAGFHHTGNYTCKAQNKLGSANRTVEVVVYTLHIIAPSKAIHTQKRNTGLTLNCPIAGTPEPKFEWIFSSLHSTAPHTTFSATGKIYRIKKLNDKHRGDYTCVASNKGGSLRFTHSVEMLIRPKIHMDKETFSAVEGDLLLKVHCNTTGNPKPNIIWSKDGAVGGLVDNIYFSAVEDWLFIKNVTKYRSEGKYRCDASSTAGKAFQPFEVEVDEYPSEGLIKNLTTIWAHENERVEIKCYIDHKKDDVIRWYRDKKLLPQNLLVLDKAKKTDSGTYTCRVNFKDLSEKISSNTKLIVGSEPKFITEEDRKIELLLGEPGSLKCLVSGDPKPKVTWWHNGVIMRFSEMVYNFVMETETLGEYKCEVTNHFGSINRTLELKLPES